MRENGNLKKSNLKLLLISITALYRLENVHHLLNAYASILKAELLIRRFWSDRDHFLGTLLNPVSIKVNQIHVTFA